MKKRVYLAGALGCYPSTERYPYRWRDNAVDSIELYCDMIPFDPTSYYNYHSNNHQSEREIMKYELRMIEKSDIVLVNLKDLDKSLGTSDEILYAYLHNIPVIGFFEGDVKECKVHPWKNEQIDRIETGRNAMYNAIEYINTYYGD